LHFYLQALDSFATWSIIIVDSVTGEIGIAGASCTYSVYGIGGIVPGKGAIVAQAMSNMNAKRKGMEMLKSGSSPEEILYVIIDPAFDPTSDLQQYGIVSLNHMDKPVTFTGGSAHPSKGSYTADGISVQGNTLANENVLKAVYDTVVNARKKGVEHKRNFNESFTCRIGSRRRCKMWATKSIKCFYYRNEAW
jgi:uncharacterized Ntn-hydrolase superfamily protein